MRIYLFRLVEEGVLQSDAVENIVTKHNSELSRAFQSADTYSPAETAQYSQVGEAQSKFLKVLNCTITKLIIIVNTNLFTQDRYC